MPSHLHTLAVEPLLLQHYLDIKTCRSSPHSSEVQMGDKGPQDES